NPSCEGWYDYILKKKFTKAYTLKVIANGRSNGIDTSFVAPEEISEKEKKELEKALGIEEQDFVFVFVGLLVGDKGINELVSAFSELRTQNSKLLLVGPLETELDPLNPETLKEIESNPDIVSVGFQKDVRPYFE